MFTIKVVLFSLLPLVFLGIPISSLLFPNESILQRWVRIPFLGMAVIVLVAQNLVYVDIPVGQSMSWIWILGAILWIIYLWNNRGIVPLRKSIDLQQHLLFIPLVMIAVYVIQGFGIFGSSARYYVGRAWFDQYNYVAIAQFVADFPFSASVIDVTDQPFALTAVNPYISPGISLLDERIGQSVYHAFVFTSAGVDAKSTFEVVILLYPIMAAVAIFWWSRSLVPARLAFFAMFWAGALPALTLVHLESFLSQALGIPFLLVFPFFVQDVCERLSTRHVVAAAMILATGVTIYAEFLPIFLAEIFLFYVFWVLSRLSFSFFTSPENKHEYNIKFLLPEKENLQLSAQVFKYNVLLLLVFIMVNIGFWKGMLMIMERVDNPGLLSAIYPWAYTPEGLARLWFGDWSVWSPAASLVFAAVGMFLTLLSYFGLFLNWLRRKTVVNLMLLTLCTLPLGLPIWGNGLEYQFYKLLLSVAPLFVVGLVCFWDGFNFSDFLNTVFPRWNLPVMRSTVFVAGVTLMFVSIGSAWHMAYLSGFGRTLEELGRGGSFLLNAPETRDIEAFLRTKSGEKILISYHDDFYGGAYINGWLAYFARNNQVYLTNSLMSNLVVRDVFDLGVGVEPLSEGALVVTSSKNLCNEGMFGAARRRLLKNDLYSVYGISGNEWVLMGQVVGPNQVEMNDAGVPFVWVDNDPVNLVVYTGKAGLLTMVLEVRSGKAYSGDEVLMLEVSTADHAATVNVTVTPQVQWVNITVLQGKNEIKFRILDAPVNEDKSESHLMSLSNVCPVGLR